MSYIIATNQGLFAGTSLDDRPLFTHDYHAAKQYHSKDIAAYVLKLLNRFQKTTRGVILHVEST